MLDLRSTPSWERHGLVLSAFSDMRDHDTLQVIYEYDPLPLRRRFEDAQAQRYVWLQRRLGSEHWEVSLRKLPASANGSIADFMTRCPIFATAAQSTHAALAFAAQSRVLPRKTIIAEQEASWPFLGVVRKGKVFAIVGTPAGREQILFEALETEVFGNNAILDGGSTFSRFATLSDAAEILLFPKLVVLQFAEADSRFALALAASSTQQMRTIVDLVHGHVSKKTIARVASALVPYAPSESGLAPVDPVHLPSLRLTQIAAATGSVKEVVARAVADLELASAIRRVRGRIAYIDRLKLTSFAS
ncbi:MAG TPA: DUF2249 domain-containing protein [Candidatus Baltobacteraceae bacterium]